MITLLPNFGVMHAMVGEEIFSQKIDQIQMGQPPDIGLIYNHLALETHVDDVKILRLIGIYKALG